MFPPVLIYDKLLETFDQSSAELFRAFMKQNANASKWLISCDFFLHDNTRPNDCFCFSITPFDQPFEDLKAAIQSVLGKDIKHIRSISEKAANLLRDGRFFHIAVILPKNRTVFNNGPGSDPLDIAREAAKISLEGCVERERGADPIARVRKLVQDSKAKNFNHELFSDVILLSLFLPFISLLISRERKADVIGWFSDRDSMTEWCDRILWDFAVENVHGLAALKRIDIAGTKFPIAVPDAGDMWFDHLVRLSDYIAGTLAVWDLKRNLVPTTPKSDKFLRVVEDVVADSENMIVLGLDIGDAGLQWKRLCVTKSAPEQSSPNPLN